MYTNEFVADRFRLLKQLLELKGENPFKTRAYDKAADLIDSFEEPIGVLLERGDLAKMDGFGKAILEKVADILRTGTFPALARLEEEIPEGVIQLFQVKGLGPKKVEWVWKKMGITSVNELYQACLEDRLKAEKGFGEKTQDKIRESIEFIRANESKFHYAAAYPLAKALEAVVQAAAGDGNWSWVGDFRRKMPVLETLEMCVRHSAQPQVEAALAAQGSMSYAAGAVSWPGTSLQARLTFVEGDFVMQVWKATGSVTHVEEVAVSGDFADEQALYKAAGMDYVLPELREGRGEVALAKAGRLPLLVEYAEIRGSLHNHSTWSDGIHSIREMAEACMKEGWEYFGISDHSQTAAYAGGLSPERVRAQHQEVDQLNLVLAEKGFQVFKGIESDILVDGSLDYEDDLLGEFDFVVASIHGQFPKDADTATARLIKAVENPFTTILGHPTGRLLLLREGYPIHHEKVIDACAANGVVIEINASPWRLDLDWTWIPHALSKGVMISVNPDAHKVLGLKDTFWGLEAARKGGLTREMTFNALTRAEMAAWFAKRKS